MIPRELNIVQTAPEPNGALALFRRVVICGALFTGTGFVTSLFYHFGLLDSLLNQLAIFEIKTVNIHTESPLDEATIRSWLPAWHNKTLLALRVGPWLELIRAKPWIESVSIRKEFPDALSIVVNTKKPAVLSVIKGEIYYLDSQGSAIERVGAGQRNAVSDSEHLHRPLPIVSRTESSDWESAKWSKIIREFPESFKPLLSEIVLEKFPYFRIFLARPKWEIALSFENWDSQVVYLAQLLEYAPSQLREVRNINLVLSKKAVVSAAFSK